MTSLWARARVRAEVWDNPFGGGRGAKAGRLEQLARLRR